VGATPWPFRPPTVQGIQFGGQHGRPYLLHQACVAAQVQVPAVAAVAAHRVAQHEGHARLAELRVGGELRHAQELQRVLAQQRRAAGSLRTCNRTKIRNKKVGGEEERVGGGGEGGDEEEEDEEEEEGFYIVSNAWSQ
jgi:hypothetical protein